MQMVKFKPNFSSFPSVILVSGVIYELPVPCTMYLSCVDSGVSLMTM